MSSKDSGLLHFNNFIILDALTAFMWLVTQAEGLLMYQRTFFFSLAAHIFQQQLAVTISQLGHRKNHKYSWRCHSLCSALHLSIWNSDYSDGNRSCENVAQRATEIILLNNVLITEINLSCRHAMRSTQCLYLITQVMKYDLI